MFLAEKTSDSISAFPSNIVPKFITFHSMLREFGAQYPFITMNEDQSDKKGLEEFS